LGQKVRGNILRAATALTALREQGILCDVLLKVNEHSIPVHSCMLSAWSMYCYNLFTKDRPRPYSECVPQVVEFKIGNGNPSDDAVLSYFKALNNVVDFFYGGNLEITDDNFVNIEMLASQLQAEEVIQHCKDYLNRRTSGDKRKKPVSRVYSEEKNYEHSEVTSAKKTLIESPRVECNYSLRTLTKKSEITGKSSSIKSASFLMEEGEPLKLDISEKENFIIKDEENSLDEFLVDENDHGSNNQDSTVILEEEDDGNRQCNKCEFIAETFEELKEHRLVHFGRPYICVMCGFRVKKPQAMLKHLLDENHGEIECSLCSYIGLSPEELRQHLQLHEGPKPFFCSFCSMRFISQTALKLHNTKHVEDRPYECEVCHKTFKIKYSLQSHMIVHSTAKQYLCDECGFSSAYKRSLEEHKMVHSGDTLKCDFTGCSFQTTKRTNLNQHILTHSNLKPHKCELCGHAFALSRGLRRHMLTHGGSQSMIHCSYCVYSSPRSDKVKAHMKKHHPVEVEPEYKVQGFTHRARRPQSRIRTLPNDQGLEVEIPSSVGNTHYTTIEVNLGDGTIIRTIALDASTLQECSAVKFSEQENQMFVEQSVSESNMPLPNSVQVEIPNMYEFNNMTPHSLQ